MGVAVKPENRRAVPRVPTAISRFVGFAPAPRHFPLRRKSSAARSCRAGTRCGNLVPTKVQAINLPPLHARDQEPCAGTLAVEVRCLEDQRHDRRRRVRNHAQQRCEPPIDIAQQVAADPGRTRQDHLLRVHPIAACLRRNAHAKSAGLAPLDCLNRPVHHVRACSPACPPGSPIRFSECGTTAPLRVVRDFIRARARLPFVRSISTNRGSTLATLSWSGSPPYTPESSGSAR